MIDPALNRLAADPSILAIPDDGEAEREKLEARLQSVKRRQSVLHDRALADRYTAPEGVLEGGASAKPNLHAPTDLPPNECEGAFPKRTGGWRDSTTTWLSAIWTG